MKKIAVIPARFASTRFPGKMMQLLGDKTLIKKTYDNIIAMGFFDDVIVVTDSELIYNEIAPGNVLMSKQHHESGSDRIAEAVENLDCDIVVNVQGDEPFVNAVTIQNLLSAFDDEETMVASLMYKIFDEADVQNPNHVKVVIDNNSNALLFSRSVIPFIRDAQTPATYFKHIGIYAYRKIALMQFTKWNQGALEQAEKLEQLRYLENGIKIKMVLTDQSTIGIDTPEDLELAKQFLSLKIKK